MSGGVLSRTVPVVVTLLIVVAVWYAGAVALNAPQAREQLNRSGSGWTTADLVHQTLSMRRPVLPTPDQVAREIHTSITSHPVTNVRNLLFHVRVTAESTVLGFAFGVLLGIVLAVGIVHLRTLEASLLPWVIASQTVPILAIAPMIVVILGNVGFTGLVPKALISAYLSFFPVTVGMVKGLRAVDPLQRDLMHTYNASPATIFWRLRLPASVPYLFASLKVSIAIALVGAIVAELPTGAQGGLGARLLSGSYFGQTTQIWAALLMAAALSAVLVMAVGLAQRLVARAMGERPALTGGRA